jgi:hypothetical protein
MSAKGGKLTLVLAVETERMRTRATIAAFVASLIQAFAGTDTVAADRKSCLLKLNPDDRQFEQVIGDNLRVVSRGSAGRNRFLLTSDKDSADACGKRGERTIYSTLDLPARAGTWVGASFDCTSLAGVKRGDLLVGRFDKSGSPAALEAWRVDRATRQFAPVHGATCHSFDR